MGKYLIDELTLTALGNAIREKTGGSATLSPEQMISAIENLNTDSGSSVGTLVGDTYTIDGYDSSAFYCEEDPHWQVGDWIVLKSHGKIGLAEITADWGGGEYVISPNYCRDWGVDAGIFSDAILQKFVFSTVTQTVTVEFHDGNPNGGGPDSYVVSYTAGQTWRDVFGGPEYDLRENHEYGGSIYFYRATQQWVIMNVRADDPI